MKLSGFFGAALMAGAMTMSSAAHAATQVVVDGKLTGAEGVDVGGTLYNVSFVDGTCVANFDGCDSTADFAFTTTAAATLAAQALLDQVFLGSFDTSPALTSGCGEANYCYSFIPYALPSPGTINAAISLNHSSSDGLTSFALSTTTNLASVNYYNFAKFELASTTGAVPEPSTWALMLVGFGALGSVMRLRRRPVTLAA